MRERIGKGALYAARGSAIGREEPANRLAAVDNLVYDTRRLIRHPFQVQP
ncbi:hypothetical protein [Devosia pacifica]|nr:hypothetical protein [Devosia pacifica]